MTKEKKYIITRSNYTLKKNHKQLNNDNIVYERDFMITNNGQTWSGDGSAYGISSFKMVNNPQNSGSYKYNTGGWLKTPKCDDKTHNGGEIWTYNCIPDKEKENSENNIHLNPNLKSLLSFVYYGSAIDLIKKSVDNIIENFPAEFVFTIYKDDPFGYEVENPFQIDLHTKSNNKNVDNNLRLFLPNCEKYHVLKYDKNAGKELSYPLSHCEREKNINNICTKSGDLLYTIKIYLKCEFVENYSTAIKRSKKLTPGQLIKIVSDETFNGIDYQKGLYVLDETGNVVPASLDEDVIIVKCYKIGKENRYYTDNYYGLRIRPNEEYNEKFFNDLDIFQKNMLNRTTTPKYKMVLDFPHEGSTGILTYKKNFIWPVKTGRISDDNITYEKWNLDIDSIMYTEYINDLLTLANFYDERCTNNLWRSLTHDSIKNMDYAFKDDKIEDNEYSLGEGRFEEIIKCFAQHFDEIKSYIDNIKISNNITYNNDSNTPAYFLSDKLENSGWEVSNLANVLDENIKFNNYSVSDTNINMMKHLQINSKQILAHKGTRHGIDMLLGLFGYKSYDVDNKSYDYKLTEYVDVVTDASNMDYNTVITYNTQKKNFDFYKNRNYLQGLPVKAVYSGINENGYDEYYLIPWFDKDETLDGNIYFQMYGGWGKTFTKELLNTLNISDDIIATKDISIYLESIKTIIAVPNIISLQSIPYNKLVNNCVAYVYDISDIESYKGLTGITLNGDEYSKKASNYFILNDVNHKGIIGSYVNEGDSKTIYGWVNVTEKDFEDNSDNGIRVKILESIIENHKGNNPHGGYGKYDDGETYVDYFRKIFKYSLENNNFNDTMYSCENGLLDSNIEKIGFDIEKQKDNVKTWYFTNTDNSVENIKLLELTLEKETNEGGETIYKGVKYTGITNTSYSYVGKTQENINVGIEADNYTFFESNMLPYKFENNENYNEAAANSIINNKKLLIEFSKGLMSKATFPRFLQECILPYLTQMIPSTTIWEVRLEGDNAVYTKQEVEIGTIDE